MHMTIWIFLCCLFPFLLTVLGAAAVFLCPRGMHGTARRIFLGFAAGVMLAASFWSLLDPAIAAAQAHRLPAWLPASVGLSAGVSFLLCADTAVARLQPTVCDQRNRCNMLLQLAMTTHNIPEGMAVGLSAALAADAVGSSVAAVNETMMTAFALSLGIGIQNLPEGAAVSLPLRQDGLSSRRAFLRGMLSGAVEPIFGLLTALLLSEAHAVMPWLLSFAAGAMLYVVVGELIPAANRTDASEDCAPYVGTLSTTAGFLVMMVLDVALG